MSSKSRAGVDLFKKHPAGLHVSEALRLGVRSKTLYAMRDAGLLEPLARGVYRLAKAPPLSNPDLVTVALKIPKGVVCLVSALSFHGITTQVPHAVHVALPFGSERPRLKHPPTRFSWFKEPAFGAGVEVHKVDGAIVRVYSPEKTVADCFKFRNKIGLDVALEALKLCLQKKGAKPDDLLRFARICRVERVMRPYLEALL